MFNQSQFVLKMNPIQPDAQHPTTAASSSDFFFYWQPRWLQRDEVFLSFGAVRKKIDWKIRFWSASIKIGDKKVTFIQMVGTSSRNGLKWHASIEAVLKNFSTAAFKSYIYLQRLSFKWLNWKTSYKTVLKMYVKLLEMVARSLWHYGTASFKSNTRDWVEDISASYLKPNKRKSYSLY